MVTVYYPLAQSKQDLQYAKLRSFTVNGNKRLPCGTVTRGSFMCTADTFIYNIMQGQETPKMQTLYYKKHCAVLNRPQTII